MFNIHDYISRIFNFHRFDHSVRINKNRVESQFNFSYK